MVAAAIVVVPCWYLASILLRRQITIFSIQLERLVNVGLLKKNYFDLKML